jgi:hypothetical protein
MPYQTTPDMGFYLAGIGSRENRGMGPGRTGAGKRKPHDLAKGGEVDLQLFSGKDRRFR